MLEKYPLHVLVHHDEHGSIPAEFLINYGVSCAINHEEKVIDVGIVDVAHKQLLFDYWQNCAYDEDE
jgi:hypothetical protein